MATKTPARLDKEVLFKDMGYEPHPGQLEVHRSAKKRRVLACGVRWGKSWAAAAEGLAAAMEPRERSIGWVVAPTLDLAERVFNQIVLVAASHLRHRIVTLKEHERRLVLLNLGGGLSEIRGKTADNPISLLGEGLDFVIVDESARLKPGIWTSYLSQRLLDREGWALLISTPKGKGWFYEMFRRGQGQDPDYQSWNFPSWTNPLLDREAIEEERTRLPDRVFRQEYGAEFIEGSGSVFRNVRECATGEWRPPVEGATYVAGLDLARVQDFSVLVVMNREREVVFADRFTKLDWSLQVGRIRAACERFHDPEVFVDSTGVGEPVYEALRAAGCRARPYVLNQRSKAALIDGLALMFEKREITLPRPPLWPEGIDELEAFEYSVTDSGSVRTGAPGGVHDDCVIALGLAAFQMRSTRPKPGMMLLDWPWAGTSL